MYDLIIIGSGPSGLAAALSARRRELNYLVIERGEIANTVCGYPLGKELFSTSNEVELEKGALPTTTKPTREEVLAHYNALVEKERLKVQTREAVLAVTPTTAGFAVRTTKGEYEARAVLVAVGGFGRTRKLQVAGETPERVSYAFVEATPFAGKPILVVGGGNSAAQAALFLAEADAKPSWSLRRPTIDAVDKQSGQPKAKIKPWVREPLEREAAAGRIRLWFATEVIEVRPQTAVLLSKITGERLEVECAHIFALLGADPETRLLETAGAEIAPDGRPVYNTETYETTAPGLYVAGHMTRELHMKNALEVTPRILDHIAARLTAAARG